jgi:magnesium chelatase family protein
MQSVKHDDKPSVSSKEMHDIVLRVHKAAKTRGQKSFTAKLSDDEIERFCTLTPDAKSALDMAIERFALSFRSIKKIQKVARTIADIASSETIQKEHLLEALSYRRR